MTSENTVLLRVLTVSSLYPNAAQPEHGVFVEQRLRKLVASGGVAAEVVAPVPWFPLKSARFGQYGVFARVPADEVRAGIRVTHPRYVVIPKIGMTLAPRLLAAALMPVVKAIMRRSPFDLIDAHYLFPDGVAALMVGRSIGRPVVLTARGSDVNVIARLPIPGGMIKDAIGKAASVITVSGALRDTLFELGMGGPHIEVLPNGVDLDMFRPVDRDVSRATASPKRLLIVGHLKEGKGHHLAISALRQLTDCVLTVAGAGPLRGALEEHARSAGVAGRVEFLGRVPHDQLVRHYNAADALVLASEREGMPNVVLEALACGTPAVASRVGGIPEALADPASGVLMDEVSVDGLVAAVRALLHARPDWRQVRRSAERFDWGVTITRQVALFNEVVGKAASLKAGTPPVEIA